MEISKLPSQTFSYNRLLGNASHFNVQQILEENIGPCRTKIACTVGSRCTDDRLKKLLKGGMSVARFNMAHRSYTEHTVTLERIRAVAKELGVHVATMMDTGHSIVSTGPLKTPDVQLHEGSQVRIITDREIEGDATTISCNDRKLSDHVDIGDTLLVDDGSLTLKVSGVGPHIIDTVAMNALRLTPRKKLVVLGKPSPISAQSATSDITTWAGPNKVDIVVVPGLLTKKDAVALRQSLGSYRPLIFGKVNTAESIEACTTMLEELDGVVISRRDLALSLAPEKIAMIQKFVVERCNAAGKPIFISSQILDSMVDRPRPTRAEVSDVANAVLDGTDGMILSARIEEGQFALEALEAMTRTCREAESAVIEEDLFDHLRAQVTRPLRVPNAIASAGILAAMEIRCKVLLTVSSSGNTARELARYRPKAAIIAITSTEAVANQMSVLRGVTSVLVPSLLQTDRVLRRVLIHSAERGLLKPGDLAVCIHGVQETISGRTCLVKVVSCPCHVAQDTDVCV